jgi:hypothetical protein
MKEREREKKKETILFLQWSKGLIFFNEKNKIYEFMLIIIIIIKIYFYLFGLKLLVFFFV